MEGESNAAGNINVDGAESEPMAIAPREQTRLGVINVDYSLEDECVGAVTPFNSGIALAYDGSQEASDRLESQWRDVSVASIRHRSVAQAFDTVTFLLAVRRLTADIKRLGLDDEARARVKGKTRFQKNLYRSGAAPTQLDLLWCRGYLAAYLGDFRSAFSETERQDFILTIEDYVGDALYYNAERKPLVVDWFKVKDKALVALVGWGQSKSTVGVNLRPILAKQQQWYFFNQAVAHYLDDRVAQLAEDNQRLFLKVASTSRPALVVHVLNEIRRGQQLHAVEKLELPSEACGKIIMGASTASNVGWRKREKQYGRGAQQSLIRAEIERLQKPAPRGIDAGSTVDGVDLLMSMSAPEVGAAGYGGRHGAGVDSSMSATSRRVSDSSSAGVVPAVSASATRLPATVGDGVSIVDTGTPVGYSLVATRPFAAGDLVTEYCGEVMSRDDAKKLADVCGVRVNSHTFSLSNGEYSEKY